MLSIGIIGNGFVGNAVHQGFRQHYDVLVYDTKESLCKNTLEEVNRASCLFVCVPTPSTKFGEIDTSFLPAYITIGFVFVMGAYAGCYALYQMSKA